MNVIFAVIFLCSSALYLFTQPDNYLSALLSGGEKAATLSIALLASYCVWLGFFCVMERSGLSKKLARLATPLCKKLFHTNDENAIFLASSNLSANLLGLPGAPTPLGVRATERFSKRNNTYALSMLFVLNATSIQLLPTTVLTLRATHGSAAPADIILPTLIATAFSTLLGVVLVRIFVKK